MLTLLGIFTGTGLIAFLVAALIIVVIAYVLNLILGELGVSPAIKKIVLLIFAVVVIIYLVNRFLGVNI